MKRVSSEPILSAIFVDYDNIYLSLKRKNEEAAKRFAKDAGKWLSAIQSGALITPTHSALADVPRRLVMNRCYGNPIPRRNTSDNSTDMNSFPFVRHNFLRNGFEIIDCPPLTAQLKNSSDIKMVMDLRDFLTHETYFDEFVILSGDADFTPVLHRLRAHARRTVIFANDNTAAPYTAIADGEIREADLIRLLIGEAVEQAEEPATIAANPEAARDRIIEVVATAVREAAAPLPLEAAAERATRALGHDITVGTNWGGSGSFLELLRAELPDDVRLSSQNPPVLYDQNRIQPARKPLPIASDAEAPKTAAEPQVETRRAPAAKPKQLAEPMGRTAGDDTPDRSAPVHRKPQGEPLIAKTTTPAPAAPVQRSEPEPMARPVEPEPAEAANAGLSPAALQKSIAKIHDASQAPPLSPPDYRTLFEEMAAEISENQLQGVQTIANVETRVARRGVQVRREDIRFVLDVVGEADPWFEQGASANLFAGRFRNFVVARCRGQGLSLSADELDLIETWFANPISAKRPPARLAQQDATPAPAPAPAARSVLETEADEPGNGYGSGLSASDLGADDMPRFVRTQVRP